MGKIEDRPIAPRRTTRRSLGGAAKAPAPNKQQKGAEDDVITVAKTPSKARSKKRVRFSDAGLESEQQQQQQLQQQQHNGSSTGLTPMVRRSSLGVAPSPKRRRHSTPLRRVQNADEENPSPANNSIIHFASLRQVLDDRLKRRIRRNGLSEEMNSIDAEKRRRVAERKTEIQHLRDELTEKDGEIERLRENTTMSQDTDRIAELERELESLRHALSERAKSEGDDDSEICEWTLAAQDPFEDHYTDDDVFGDSSMADVACSTPSKPKAAVSAAAFPTPPSTSPAVPTTPFTFQQQKPLPTPLSHVAVQASTPLTHSGVQASTPSSHAGVQVSNPSSHAAVQAANPSFHAAVQTSTLTSHASVQATTPSTHTSVQASLPDPEKEALERELGSLRHELSRLTETLESHTKTLESHEALKARLSSKLKAASASLPASPSLTTTETKEGEGDGDIESHLDTVLQGLSDRTAALLDLSSSLGALGFPGKDGGEVIASLATAFRAARLELEYLSPGESTLPLSSRGAEVLDLVLQRLRALAQKSRADDDAIDEYHALELSLRQQLSARVDAGEKLGAELARAGAGLRERDERIADLEVGVDRLKGALADYRRDAAELEDLVRRLEAGGRETEVRLQVEAEAAEAARAELARRAESGADADAQLQEALAQVQVLEEQLPALSRAHGRAVAEVEAADAALRAAHETIRELRLENACLAGRADDGKARTREVVDALKIELERVVRMSSDLMASAAATTVITSTPRKEYISHDAGVVVTPSLARIMSATVAEQPVVQQQPTKASKRRRYDSGLGFLDEIEDGEDLSQLEFM